MEFDSVYEIESIKMIRSDMSSDDSIKCLSFDTDGKSAKNNQKKKPTIKYNNIESDLS